jgi:hypothetical protein
MLDEDHVTDFATQLPDGGVGFHCTHIVSFLCAMPRAADFVTACSAASSI